MGRAAALAIGSKVIGKFGSGSAVADRSDRIPSRGLKTEVGDPGRIAIQRCEHRDRTVARAMASREPDQFLLGRGGDDGARPGQQGGNDYGRGLARALDAEQENVVLGRRLEEVATEEAKSDAVTSRPLGSGDTTQARPLAPADPAAGAVALRTR